MQRKRNRGEVDGKIVTVVGLALATFMMVAALAMGDGIDQLTRAAVRDAQATQPAAATRAPAAPADNGPWHADESARGTRPDSAH